ncbi:U3 small nucleolar ribonucleoprotein complex, subunit Mpp10 [Umbelopsis sp. PMI_123]|nr:U3 small nucleolar ribonucleoprotein complex, subunit Mpp10 [Umbelopsis sp. PMI_123]
MVGTRRSQQAKQPISVLDTFVKDVIEKPQIFFAKDEQSAAKAIAAAKDLFDTAKKIETVQFSPFDELLTEGFDNEQIWEELALQNNPFIAYAKEQLEYFEEEEESHSSDDIDGANEDSDLEAMDETEEFGENLASDETADFEDALEEQPDEAEDEEEYGEDEEEEEDNFEDIEAADESDDALDLEEFDERPTRTGKPTEVDDEFFDLKEFNEWTEKQEEQDMLSESEREADEEIDFDEDLEDDLEDEDEQNANDIMFGDFFKPPPKPYYSRGDRSDNRQKNGGAPKKKAKELDPFDGMDEDEDDNGSDLEEDEDVQDDEETKMVKSLFDDEEEDADQGSKSAHEKRLEHIKEQIEELEMQNVGAKDWTLGGEASAKARPINSLLEENLEFDHAAKPVPVITQETTASLEDIIKQRIIENKFDDVVRKADPADRPFLPSKLVELDDSKSKKSLAELYEDDYVKQTSGVHTNEKDEKLKKEHTEIDDMFKGLCQKLDALSNFHYTPKAPKPEITVVSNAAAISMEEVIPVNVSDATLLAPEEVFEKKRTDVKGETELDQTERAKIRAAKKKSKRKEKAMREREVKVIEKMNPGRGNKHAKSKAFKELIGQKNVSILDKDGKKASSETLSKFKV